MAKRARGSVRPGQRRPIDRRPVATTAAVTPKPSGLTADEEARAAELEQQLLAEERAAEAARARARVRTTREVSSGTTGSLAVRAEKEYAYVARDVKDIGRMAVLMLAILLGFWVVIDIMKVITIS